MTDRELLEFAAKAAGLNTGKAQDGQWFYCENGQSGEAMYLIEGSMLQAWNPITDNSEAMRLTEACKHGWLENVDPDKCDLDDLLAILRQQTERIAELEAERDQHQNTATSLLSLLADIRKACGDNGKRMQPELVEFIEAMSTEHDQLRAEVERLKPNAERYEWLRDNLESEWAICEWQDDPDGIGYYRDARAPEFVDAAIDHARTTHKDEASA